MWIIVFLLLSFAAANQECRPDALLADGKLYASLNKFPFCIKGLSQATILASNWEIATTISTEAMTQLAPFWPSRGFLLANDHLFFRTRTNTGYDFVRKIDPAAYFIITNNSSKVPLYASSRCDVQILITHRPCPMGQLMATCQNTKKSSHCI
jgi:hypothetical protein